MFRVVHRNLYPTNPRQIVWSVPEINRPDTDDDRQQVSTSRNWDRRVGWWVCSSKSDSNQSDHLYIGNTHRFSQVCGFPIISWQIRTRYPSHLNRLILWSAVGLDVGDPTWLGRFRSWHIPDLDRPMDKSINEWSWIGSNTTTSW